MGQKTANTNYELGDTAVDAEFWMLLSQLDKVGSRADGKREFPFDSSVNTVDFLASGYGSGLKTAAKMTVLLPAAAKFVANASLNKFGTLTEFALLAADNVNVAGEGSQPSGMVQFKIAKTKWGYQCCVSNSCSTEHSNKKCNIATASANALKFLSVNQLG
jgi:hypothetical protein